MQNEASHFALRVSWFVLLAVASALVLTGCSEATGSAQEPAKDETPRALPADSFVDSMGVNVAAHVGYLPYGNWDKTIESLQMLGFRNVRSTWQNDEVTIAHLRELEQAGMQANLIVGNAAFAVEGGDIDELIAPFTGPLRGAVNGIEGPNEWDIMGPDGTHGGPWPKWDHHVRTFQKELYRTVRSHDELDDVPVIGPSYALMDAPNVPDSFARVGAIKGAWDFANLHPYQFGHPPEAVLDFHLGLIAPYADRKPVWATETGYHNAMQDGTIMTPVSERAGGIYMPRLFAENFRRRIARTYTYQLFDYPGDPQGRDWGAHLGLFHHDYTPKPAAIALSRMTELLADPGPDFDTRRIEFEVEGDDRGVRNVVLEKRDGSVWLLTWRDANVWNRRTGRFVPAAPQDVTIRAAGDHRITEATTYRPTSSDEGEDEDVEDGSFDLTLTAELVITRLDVE